MAVNQRSRDELNAWYREATGTPLVESEEFIRWLDKQDAHGNEMYERFCPVCRGDKRFFHAKRNEHVTCTRCKGAGTTIGPQLCPQCRTILPHLPTEKCLG